MKTVTFKPKQVSKNLLVVLPGRSRDVVASRFGLGREPQKRTLESIGKQYGITRERVRQIENFALGTIKKSDAYEEEKAAFDEMRNFLASWGGILAEKDLLGTLAKDESAQNHLYFLLVLGDDFERRKEDEHFRHRWSIEKEVSEKVHQALHNLHQSLSKDDLTSEAEILSSFSKQLSDVPDEYKRDEVLRKWLNLSKVIGKNQLEEWGLASSPNIRARGIRDYAYLVIRDHGSPLHFTEVAKAITKTFECPAHVATCHNELIKDKERFVLVGRGLYALTSWGYSNGVVREVIMNILKEHGSLSKDDLVQRVLKDRYVKENTIIVNLQNKKYFARDKNGNYALA